MNNDLQALLGRARELADHLDGEARKHATFDATMRKIASSPSLDGDPMPVDDADARAAARLVQDATTVRRLIEAVERGDAG
jgi:hypothetical protein